MSASALLEDKETMRQRGPEAEEVKDGRRDGAIRVWGRGSQTRRQHVQPLKAEVLKYTVSDVIIS